MQRIRSFVCVAELRSFRRASETLKISSSAISNHIREIEEDFGVPLFYRTTRTVSLTPEGARFLSGFQEIINDTRSLIEEMHNASSIQSVGLTIACVPTLSETVLPYAMKILSERRPDVEMKILDFGAHQLADLIANGDADFGVMPPPEAGAGFETMHLIDEPLVAVTSHDHPLAGRRQIKFSELANHAFIALKSSKSISAALERAALQAGVTLKPVYELKHHYSIGGLVCAGFGISVLPAMAMPMERVPGLVGIPIVEPHVSRPIDIVWRKGETLPAAAHEFVTILKKIVRDLQKKRLYVH